MKRLQLRQQRKRWRLQRPKHVRTQGKSVSFLAVREEELVPTLLEALPPKVQGATANF